MTVGRKRQPWWKAVARAVLPRAVRATLRSWQPAVGRRGRLAALTPAAIETVRADPTTARDLYAGCRAALAADLGPAFRDLPDADLRLVFCAVLAHALAPYGPSDALTLPALLAAPRLNCGNYPFLMIRLAELVADGPAPVVSLVGWAGGAVGAHAMGYRSDPAPRSCLFLDPTVGLVARATFDEVAGGRPVAQEKVVCFGDRAAERPYRERVMRAFVYGHFRPSDVFYYFETLDHQLSRYGDPRQWPTPGAVAWRLDHPPAGPG